MLSLIHISDEVLQQAVQGITDLINVPGLINLDFADVKTVMVDKGVAHIGIGTATVSYTHLLARVFRSLDISRNHRMI